MKKRVLTVLLSFVMVACLLPIMAMADGEHTCDYDSYGICSTCQKHNGDFTNWTAWSGEINPNDYGNNVHVYLTGDVELTTSIYITSGTTYLNLNDHLITHNNSWGAIIRVSGGKLRVYDVPSTTRYGQWVNDAYVITEYQPDGEYNTLFGGVIYGGKGSTYQSSSVVGGGILSEYGNNTLVMYGGTVAGNKASGKGGGICSFSPYTKLVGVTVVGNKSDMGGGIYNTNSASLTDCTIEYNEATIGGGVYNSADDFTLAGNTKITGNTNDSGAANNFYYAPSNTWYRLELSELTCADKSIGISLKNNSSPFASNAAAYVNKFQSDDSNYIVDVSNNELKLKLVQVPTYTITPAPTENGSFTVKVGDGEATTATAGATVTITATPNDGYEVDTVAVYKTGDESSTVEVTDNKFEMPAYAVTVSVTFRLIHQHILCQTNGCTLDHNGDATGSGHDAVHFVPVSTQAELQNAATNGGSVYLKNSIELAGTINVTGILNLCLNGHTLKNTAANTRVIDITGGTLNLTDCGSTGTITGGSFTSGVSYNNLGAGVKVTNGAFNMYAGAISANTSNGHGGGVYNEGTFTMYGGVISGNTAAYGGGVYNNRTFTMLGGVISGNTANSGGGVECNDLNTIIAGGSIINNTANGSPSGGIRADQSLTLSGTPVISGNKYGDNDGYFDIYKNYTAIRVTEDFAPTGSPIRVFVDSTCNDRVFLETADSGMDVDDYIGYFENVSDFPLYKKDGKYYAGFVIIEEPTSENNYTVKVNSEADLSRQWYKKELVKKVLTDWDVFLMMGEYDPISQSFTMPERFLQGEILLNAGDQLIVSAQSEMKQVRLGDMAPSAVEQDGNTYTYTFTVTSTYSYYFLMVEGDSGVSIKLTKKGFDFAKVEDQTALTLDTRNLEEGDYKCHLVWGRGTDNTYDDIETWSEVVTYTVPTCTVTVSANPGEGGTVNGGGNYTAGATVTITATPNDGYKFVNWTENGTEVSTTAGYTFTATEDRNLVANFKLNKFTITWIVNGVTTTEDYEYGATPSFKGDTTKADTAQYAYTFKGWTPAIEAVTGNATYTATYTETVKKYTVKFENEDGTELQISEVAYGETPVYEGATPAKAATAQYTYTFAGWDKEIVSVTGDATYTATYSSAVNKYTITFVNADGTTVLESKEWVYGETPVYTGETPTKAADAQYTYTFKGWTPAIEAVTGNATYTATYTATQVGYLVVSETTIHGTAKANCNYATRGSTVTVTVTADKGYVLDKLTVTDHFGRNVDVTKMDGKYTFKMPAARVMIKVIFKEEIAFSNPFEDVFTDDYYNDAVMWAFKEGITNGTTATTFSPNGHCTRAQMVTFLWRAAGCPEPMEETCIFTDVAEDAYYAKAVQWAYEQKITNGTSATTFSPDAECTRAHMATFLWRIAGSEVAESSTSQFTDVTAEKYYAVAVQWAYEQMITNGTTATTFSPDDPCTRAQMVTFLYRYYVK